MNGNRRLDALSVNEVIVATRGEAAEKGARKQLNRYPQGEAHALLVLTVLMYSIFLWSRIVTQKIKARQSSIVIKTTVVPVRFDHSERFDFRRRRLDSRQGRSTLSWLPVVLSDLPCFISPERHASMLDSY